MMRCRLRWLLCCTSLLSPVALKAGEVPHSFTLGKYVPADYFLYIHFVHNPERAWLEAKWTEVWEALKATGIGKDLLTLIMNQIGEQDRAKAEELLASSMDLLAGVRWDDLIGKEIVFTERLGVPPEYIVLMRGTPDSGKENVKGLVDIMTFILAQVGGPEIKEEKIGDVESWGFRIEGDIPYGVHLIRFGDVVGLILGATAREEILAMISGEGAKPGIISTPRFKEAIATVTSPEDGLIFMDFRHLLKGVDKIIELAAKKEQKAEDQQQWRKPVSKILNMCDVADFQITTVETDGRQERTYSYVKMQADKVNTPLPKAFLGRKPFSSFDKFIPADATGFSISGFIDLELLYDTVLNFIETEIPDGKKAIQEWNEVLANAGFNPKEDVFSWWSGEMISIDLPAAAATPFSASDSVLMIRVKDASLAKKKLCAATDWLVRTVSENFQQPVDITPADVSVEGFQQITIGPLAMIVRPVFGVHDEWLVLASSPGAVNKCLDVASKKSPSIATNERFREEGIIPKGAVMSSSFTDTSRFGQDLAAGLGMVSMFGGMGIAQIPEHDPEAKDFKRIAQKILGMVMKLTPVVSKIDFFSSESSVSTWDGKGVRFEYVVSYKPMPGNEKTASAAHRAPAPPTPPKSP